jgi:hypothetical protein
MRRLPPLPLDFVRLTVGWAAGDGGCSTSWNIFNPGSSSASFADLQAFVADWFLNALPALLPLLGTDCSASTCRAATVGSQPLIYETLLAPNVGAVGTTNPFNGSLCLTWRTADAGRRSVGHTLLPLSDTVVDTDHKSIRQVSYAFAVSQATAYLNEINALASVDGGLCVLALVHRSLAGRPLAASTWSPVVGADASLVVGTVQRRIRSRRPVPPF